MASVKIDSGLPVATDRPDYWPKEKWFALMQEKRTFLKYNILTDCRCLLEFIEDAKLMWDTLGYESAEDMIRNGYELDPAEVDLAISWLKIKAPDEAVAYEQAVKEGRKLRDKPGAPKGNKNACKNNPDDVMIDSGKKEYGNSAEYLKARLERDAPDVAEDLAAGKFTSVRQAAIAAGIVKTYSPFQEIVKKLGKLDRMELLDLKAQIESLLKA